VYAQTHERQERQEKQEKARKARKAREAREAKEVRRRYEPFALDAVRNTFKHPYVTLVYT
jgi:hypothetical protein